jgi:hypothetical protein
VAEEGKKMTSRDAEQMTTEMDCSTWLRLGIEMGFCGPVVCYSHDGLPTTAVEAEDWESGHDPCIHLIRMYQDDNMRDAVEENHAPSVPNNLRCTGL